VLFFIRVIERIDYAFVLILAALLGVAQISCASSVVIEPSERRIGSFFVKLVHYGNFLILLIL